MRLRPAIIVVAAGQGSRYRGPQHKLLESIGSTSVLGMTLRHALMTRLPVVAVTTEPLAEQIGRILASRDVILVPEVSTAAPAAQLGMGFSIGAGVAACGDADGWLVLPGDMPLVRPASMLAVAAALEEHPVAFAQYQGRRGHPVGFAQELFSELVDLRGDEGARRIVARYPAHGVTVDDPGVLADIDTEDDLRRARAAFTRVGELREA